MYFLPSYYILQTPQQPPIIDLTHDNDIQEGAKLLLPLYNVDREEVEEPQMQFDFPDERLLLRSLAIREFGDQGRWAARAIQPFHPGVIIGTMQQGATIKNYKYAQAVKNGAILKISLAAWMQEGEGRPFRTVFTYTNQESEANVRFVEGKTIAIVATKQISPGDLLRCLVVDKVYKKWCEEVLSERHNRQIAMKRFALEVEDHAMNAEIGRLIESDEIYLDPSRREEWNAICKAFKRSNWRAVLKWNIGTPAAEFILNRLVMSEIRGVNLFDKCTVVFLNKKAGCVVQATQRIADREFFGFYSGTLMKHVDANPNDGFFFGLDGFAPQFAGWGISALDTGNITRFITFAPQSDRKCNAVTYPAFFGDRVYILFMAIQPILEGEAIYYNYLQEAPKIAPTNAKRKIPVEQQTKVKKLKENTPEAQNKS